VFGFNKVFGLDIGNGAVKSCDLSVSGKTAKLNKISFVKTDHAAYKSGEILNPGLLGTTIKSSAHKIKSKKAVIAMSGASVMVKKITIPRMDLSLLPEQIWWEAKNYIPYYIEEVNIDYVVLNSQTNNDTMDVLLVAAQQNRISQHVESLAGSKIKVELVDVASFALANCFSFNYPEEMHSTVGLIDVGAFFTHLVILRYGEVVFCRDIPSGGALFDEALAANLGISEEEAVMVKESGEGMPDIAVDTLRSSSKKYADQVLGAFEFFTNTNPGMEIERFYLTGGAGLTLGLMDALSDSLEKPVTFMDVLRSVTPSSQAIKDNSEFDLQYKSAVAIGLAMRKTGDVK
jgi:type IV pilus assembly protein PilM